MMTNILDLLAGDWAQRLGWTLLHSLWQGLVIFAAVYIALRLIPLQKSQLRYMLACAGLLLILFSSAVTFMTTDAAAPVPTETHPSEMAYMAFASYTVEEDVPLYTEILSAVGTFVGNLMPLIVAAWVAGFLFFGLRLVMGLRYNQKLIASAIPLEDEWALYIKETAENLGIHRLVSLAQLASINTPVVIGYLKPVILIPMGMVTGLSTEQLQTIFLHELAHIKRNDYLVNVIQSLVEVVLFFNPFVWRISDMIRTEREYCCDDMVVRRHGGVRAYAHALAQLAENSLLAPVFALPATGSKNQLLNRIKRIMEKSVANQTVRSRMLVPAILLLAGLFCISWLGIQKDEEHFSGDAAGPQDTIIENNMNGARYSRRSIITIDENGQPHEEIIEKFEGNEELRPLMQKQFESFQDFPSLTPPLPRSFHAPALPAVPAPPDTIPPPLNLNDQKEWEEFSRTFQERFEEGFGDVFAFKEGELSDMLKELEEKFGSEDWPSRFDFDLPSMSFDSAHSFFDKESFKQLEQELEQLRSLNFERFEKLKEGFDGGARKMDRYEDVLLEQLRKDGYLSEDETIQSLEWNNEVLKVNGKQIKEADEEKYREINRQYFNRKPLEKFE